MLTWTWCMAADHVFDETSTQEGVYKACASNIIESTLNGQNGDPPTPCNLCELRTTVSPAF